MINSFISKTSNVIIVIILALFVAKFTVVMALEESSEVNVQFSPNNIFFSGEEAGDNTSIGLTIDLANIPQDAKLKSAKFSFIQDNTDTGLIKIIDKNTATTIDTLSLDKAGLRSTSTILTYAKSWIKNPTNNRGILLQTSNLSANAQIYFIDIKLEIQYTLPDNISPIIIDTTLTELDNGDIQIDWTSDEPTNGYILYGKTSNYSIQTDYTIDYKLQNSIILTDLTPGMTYHYKLTIEDASSNQTHSQDKTFQTKFSFIDNSGTTLTILADKLNPPTGFTAGYLNDTVILEWSKSHQNSVVGYVIYKKEGINTYKEIATLDVDTTSYIDSDIYIDSRYTYMIRAFSNTTISSASSEKYVLIANPNSKVLGTSVEKSEAFNKNVQKGLIIFSLIAGVAFIIYVFYKHTATKLAPKEVGFENVLRNPEYYK